MGDLPLQQSQNLTKRVRERPFYGETVFWKAIVFDVLVVAVAAALGYFYKGYLEGTVSTVWLAVVGGVFLVVSAIEAILPRSMRRRLLILIFEAIAVLVFFLSERLDVLLLSGGFFVIFSLWGDKNCRDELGGSLEVKFFKATRQVFTKSSTAFIILFLTLYLPYWNLDSIFVPVGTWRSFYGSTAAFINKFYPEIDVSSKFGSLAESVARLELQNNKDYLSLPEVNRESIVKQSSAQVVENLSKSLGVTIKPDEQTSDVFYDFIVNILKKWYEQFQQFFIIGWSLVVFIIARSLAVIVYWLASLVAFVIYQLLLSFGAIHIVGESRTHEVIEY